MSKNLGKDVTFTFDNESYNYDSVVFQAGRPVLDSEVNLSQQLQQDLLRKVSLSNGSGWVSYREHFAEPGIPEAFYTQKPEGAIPEMAIVNGWPIYVANTNTVEKHSNLVDLTEFPLVAGARADGVFLEVWRGLIDDQMTGVTTPTDLSLIDIIRDVCTVTSTLVWAVGDNGMLLRTDNAGVTWLVQPSPTSSTLRAVKFLNASVGFIAGDSGALYKTENGGQSWTRISLPVVNNINAMSVIGENLMVLVGDNGTVLRSMDFFNFELILATEQASDDILSVFFNDLSIGWACGKGGLYMRTLDGGISWRRIAVNVPDEANPLKEKRITEQLNCVRFVNLSDGWAVGNGGLILRTTDGGLRWANVSESIYDESAATPGYTRTDRDLNRLEVVKSYPVRISLSIFDSNRFRSAYYIIGPQYLDLYYQRVGEDTSIRERLALAQYPKDTDLVTAINAVLSSDGYRVFNATLSYAETSYLTHKETDKIYGNQVAEIKFSMGDVAWIVGDQGTVLYTSNGGARWTPVEAEATFDLYSVSFLDTSLGWVVGDQGEISSYNSSRSGAKWVGQDTNMVKQVQRKVFFNGNTSSPASINLVNDSIHPDIKVETTARTQIQYRIRVVEGIDLQNFRDSGLGAPYVFSKGPNSSVVKAGSYTYENMGPQTGDYGMWRALCRNTVDGYTYAIPMFVLSRRNQQPYNAVTNVNGSSIDAINAVRPDGLLYEDIVQEDILDVRRKITQVSTSEILGRTFDNLLAGKLATTIVQSPLRGGQIGVSHTYVDEFSGSNLTDIFAGTFNTEAFVSEPTYVGGSSEGVPGVSGFAPTGASFSPLTNAMYHHSVYQYSATYKSTSADTAGWDGLPIPGYFTGMGTTEALFVFNGETGVQQAGVNYVIEGKYIDYSREALARTPANPLQVKNYINGQPNQSLNYSGVQKGVTRKVARRLTTGVSGLSDYVELSAESFGDTLGDCSSKVRLHLFQEVSANTTTIKVPKNNEGYFIFGVKQIRNVNDGGIYRILNILPKDGVDDNTLVVQLASTYTVVEGSLIEIIAEVTSASDDDLGYVGQYTTDKGETVDSVRNSYVSIFDSTVRGVNSLFKGALQKITIQGSKYPLPTEAVGISTMPRLEGLTVPYVWALDINGSPTGTVAVTVERDSNGKPTYVVPLEAGLSNTILVPLLLSESSNPLTNSTLSFSYKVQAPQTLQPLPVSLEVEVLEKGDAMVVSSLGNGGGIRCPYFLNPLEQIPVFDDLTNQSYFFNLFGLEFKSFYETEGFVTVPLRVSRHPGKTLTLSNPGMDVLGRTYYRGVSEVLNFTAEELSLGNPRKLMVPMLVKVTSLMQSPVLKGEVLLAVVTSYENTVLENKVLIGPDAGKAVVALYKVPGMPILK